MEQIVGSIYDWPNYYEFVYGSDWRAETEFLQGCFDRFVEGETVRLFEPACGTGRLIFRLGQLGFHVSGLDLNEKAVAFCNQRFHKHAMENTAAVWQGDMCDFSLPEPCDAAFNTINSFRHLASDTQAKEHFRCMAAAIRSGGVYVLGLHLTPTLEEPEDAESWSHRQGHLQINTSMWLVDSDEAKRMETHAIAFDVYTPTKQFRIQDYLQFRTYTVPQFQGLLDETPEFEVAEVFDFTYDLQRPVPLDGATQDALFVLKRR